MFQTGKTIQVSTEMNNYKLEIMGISEARWTQSGRMRLLSGEMILYSGHEEEGAPHTEGVALMLSRTAQKVLDSLGSSWARIMTASFRTKKKKIKMNE